MMFIVILVFSVVLTWSRIFECRSRGCSVANVDIPLPATLELAWREENSYAWIRERVWLILTYGWKGGFIGHFQHILVPVSAVKTKVKECRASIGQES